MTWPVHATAKRGREKSQLRHDDDDNAVKIKKKKRKKKIALIKMNKYCCQKNTRYIRIRYEESTGLIFVFTYNYAILLKNSWLVHYFPWRVTLTFKRAVHYINYTRNVLPGPLVNPAAHLIIQNRDTLWETG